MIETVQIQAIVTKVKKAIKDELKVGKTEIALSLISCCATILYKTNFCYADTELENFIKEIADALDLSEESKNINTTFNDDTVMFWDGFGLDHRGLAQIYLKALGNVKHVVYITFDDRADKLQETNKILHSINAEIYYLHRDKKSKLNQIKHFAQIIEKVRPGHFFFYSGPSDVVAPVLMHKYGNLFTRYQINLTDHAFWLGSSCIDKCIEFRNYGAKISKFFRGIDESKIVVIPFYPIIYDTEFLGFPFHVQPNQVVVFSGGSLYKTLGDDNKYYKIVGRILSSHPEVIFWYAGYGDATELNKILKQYPGRAFHTEERADLPEVLKHSRLYLSTYPVCGGLMYQYAAMAGRVPVTLKNDIHSDGFLIQQEKLCVEFNSIEDLCEEIDRLITDETYWLEREQEMKQAVIKPQLFESEVAKLFSPVAISSFPVSYEKINTDNFKEIYLENTNKFIIKASLIKRNTIVTGVKSYPLDIFEGLIGGGLILHQRLIEKAKFLWARRG